MIQTITYNKCGNKAIVTGRILSCKLQIGMAVFGLMDNLLECIQN